MTNARPLSRLLAATLIALLATSLWPASATRVAAADDSNIPGVPLPGPKVSGLLGGPIYDHVYSLSVAPDSVLLISLSGEAGTDFDLYLFDSSATTIFTNDGLVAKSTTSTSTESISYPTKGGGLFYLDVSGFSNTEGTFHLTVSASADTAPPVATLVLAGGAVATPDSAVRVTLIGTDDLSGVESMQFSDDGSTWQAWQPYLPSLLWTFPSGDGVKRLWGRVRDRSGNVSNTATASIVLDTVAPSVDSRSPGPNATVAGLRPVFSVRFSEAIDPASWAQNGLLVQDAAGTTMHGTYHWDDNTDTGTFQPSVNLVAGGSYVVSLGAIVDLAGNGLASIGSWVVTPLMAHQISLVATPAAVAPNATVKISGHIDLPVQGALSIEQSIAGGPWNSIAGVLPDASGNFGIVTSSPVNAAYRARLSASSSEAAVVSSVAKVAVRRQISLLGVSSSTARTSPAGRTISLRAVLGPLDPATVVTLTIYRYNTSKRVYVAVGTIARTSVKGIAAFAWKPTVKGSYYVRLTTPASDTYAVGTTSAYRWVIN